MTAEARCAQDTPPTRLLSRDLVVLGVVTVLFFASIGATNPVLPRFVSDELGGGNVVVGAVVGAFAVASILLRPYFGRLGDRRGPRLLVIVGCLIGGGGMLAHLLAVNPVLAFLVRLPVGIGLAAVMVGATTLAVNLAPVSRRGEAASYTLMAFHLGLGLGPLLGEALLNAAGYAAVWLALAGLNLAGACVALGLRRSRPRYDLPPGRLFHPQGVLPGVVIGLGMMGFVGFSAFVTLYGQQIGVHRVAPVFLVASITIAAVRVIGGKVPDRLGPVRAGTAALTVAIAGLMLIAVWAQPVGLYLGTFVLAVGASLLMPAMLPVAVHGVAEHHRSSALATCTMFLDVGVALSGPLLGLAVIGSNYAGVFVAGAGSAVMSLLVLLVLLRRKVPRGRLTPVDPVSGSGVDTV